MDEFAIWGLIQVLGVVTCDSCVEPGAPWSSSWEGTADGVKRGHVTIGPQVCDEIV